MNEATRREHGGELGDRANHAGGTRLVTLYGRPHCHLCEQARVVLTGLRGRLAFDLCDVNIELDDDLHRRFLERIPVIAVGDEIVCELDGFRHDTLAAQIVGKFV